MGFIPLGFMFVFIRGGGELFHLFLFSPAGTIKTVFFKSTQMQCLHSTFFLKKKKPSRLLISNHVGKVECSYAIPGHRRGINTA